MGKRFTAWYRPPPKKPVSPIETIVYVGCVHGIDDEFLRRFLDLIKDRCPNHVIFLGDVIGTEELACLQKLFYNYVTNQLKALFEASPEPSDEEIIDYVNLKSPKDEEDGHRLTLEEGYLRLLSYKLKLLGLHEEEIIKKTASLSDSDIASRIRDLRKFEHYGHYVSSLPEKVRVELVSRLEKNTYRLLELIKTLRDQEVEVYVIWGNWEARSPLDFKSGELKAIPLLEKERPFSLATHLDKNNIPFAKELSLLETETTLQILAPFDAIIKPPDESYLECLRDKVEEARGKDKTIVLVGHGEPNWRIHNLLRPNSVPAGEHADLIKGYRFLIPFFLPDKVVYSHIHNRISDEKGGIVNNWKYVLEVSRDYNVVLVTDPGEIGKTANWQVVATHIPFREMGLLIVRENDGKNLPEGMRNPVEVLIGRD